MARPEDDPIDDKPMPLLDHLIELRRRLIWSAATFLVCFGIAYYFAGAIYYFLAEPLATVLREQGNPDPHLIYTQLYEAFFTKIKVAFFGGAFVAFPMIATQIWLFVAPGLYRSEKRAFLPFLAATPILFRARRGAGLLLRLPVRLAVLRQLPGPGRRRRRADRAVAAGQRIPRPGDEADLRLRHHLPASGRADAAGEGRDHQFGATEEVPALRLRRVCSSSPRSWRRRTSSPRPAWRCR